MTVKGGADAEKELERVADIVPVIAIESVGTIIDGELRPEFDVEAVAVRQVANVTERVGAYVKDARSAARLRTSSCPDFTTHSQRQ